MNKYILAIITLISFSFTLSQALADPWKEAKPRICLVLKGGGALGFAHVGVLKVLEENRIPIHCIAGTSMGSIVGAAYASGNSMDEILKVITSTSWGELFGEKIQRANLDFRNKAGRNREIYGDLKISVKDGNLQIPTGIVEGQNIRPLFQKLFTNLAAPVHFDDLPVPFRAITTDLETGEIYVPESGDLATVVRASMSVPGAFAPVEIDGRYLVDGGLTENLPVETALKLGADVLIVVDLKSKLATRKDLTTPFSISGQFVSMLLMQNAVYSRKLVREHDVVIEPDVSDYTVTNFDLANKILTVGEKATANATKSFEHLALSPEEYAEYQKRRQHKISTTGKIDFIRVNNNSKISDKRIIKEAGLKVGQDLDIEKVQKGISKLYQSGYFSSVQYSVLDESEKKGLLLDAKAKSWLDEYVRMGFGVEDNLDGENNFRLGLAYRSSKTSATGYNEVSAEIGQFPQLTLEHFSLITPESDYFVNPLFRIGRSDLIVRSNGEEIAEYQREAGAGTMAIGRRLDTLGELALFYTRGWGELNRQIGDPTLPELSYDQGDLGATLSVDKLDKPDFPTEGYSGNLTYFSSLEEMGATDNFEVVNGGLTLPQTFGRNTFILGHNFSHSFGSMPTERFSSLGGFLSVSGSTINSLATSDYHSTQLMHFRRFSEAQNPFFDLAFYLGSTLEYSYLTSDSDNLEDLNSITSGSVFFGADTPLLPLYLSFGANDNNDQSIYINLGRIGRPRSAY